MSRKKNSGNNRGRGYQDGSSPRRLKGQRRNSSSGPPNRRSQGRRGTMPRRYNPTSRSQGPSLGGDQVEGRQAVRELLLAGTRRTHAVVLASDLDDAPILDDIVDLAKENKVPIRELARSKFESMARTSTSQGVLATAAPLQPTELANLLGDGAGADKPFLLLLDGITDPQNLGAILRTAECAGVTGVVLPRYRAVHITPSATKAAAGAVEHLRMALVGGLPAAMQTLSDNGVWTVGLDASGDQSIHQLTVADEPIALVLGAEGTGLSRLVRQRCDALASIPLQGVLGSLNVSAAAAVFCFEILDRRSN